MSEDPRPPRIRRAESPSFAHEPWFRIYIDQVTGDSEDSGYGRIVESEGRLGVAILPLKQGHIGLVHQYRVPIGAYTWELPRGFGEHSAPLNDARRELEEETGITNAQWTDLGEVYANTGLLATPIRVFVARVTDLARADPAEGNSNEISKFRWWALSEIGLAIRGRRIPDGITLAVILKAAVEGHIAIPGKSAP